MKNKILQQVNLEKYNTFGIKISASSFINVDSEEVLRFLYTNKKFDFPFFILGQGSNVLFTKNYTGLIIHMANKGIQHFIEGNQVFITAAAGEIWNDLVWYCVDHDFSGLENMALIPGTVGASPIQNIGAYGQELMHILYSLRAFDTLSGECVTFSNEDCQFSYRDSIFKNRYKGRYIILSVTYQLPLENTLNTSYGAIETELQKRGILDPTIKDVAEIVSLIRVEKLPDPSTIGNAGSFFKNPIINETDFLALKKKFPTIVSYPMGDGLIKLAAAWLIESCGWKGKTVGQVKVWKNQALVLTNLGKATGNDIYNVSSTIVDDVQTVFGVTLEREVNIL